MRNTNFSCNCAKFTPFIGIRAAWIDQKLSTCYDQIAYRLANLNAPNIIFPHSQTTFCNQFTGVGLRGGANVDIPIWRSLSVIGGASASLVNGRNKLHEILNGFDALDTVTTFQATALSRIHHISANFESELGLRYNKMIGCSQVTFTCSYYMSLWLNQNQFLNSAYTVNASNQALNSSDNVNKVYASNYPQVINRGGNLNLQGLVLGVGYIY